MIKLKKVSINKYKSIETEQSFSVEEDTSILVGMNESGKTAILEAIAKTNYLDPADEKFKFHSTLDYPRKEKKKFDKSGENPVVVSCEYELSNELIKEMESDLGSGVVLFKSFVYSKRYDNSGLYGGVKADLIKFLEYKVADSKIEGKTITDREKFKQCLDTCKDQFSQLAKDAEFLKIMEKFEKRDE